MAEIIDGKKEAELVLAEVKKEAESLKAQGITPGLAMVMVGANPASQVYVGNKEKKAQSSGIHSETFWFSEDISEKDLIFFIESLNVNPLFNGILVQLPLPKKFDTARVLSHISVEKDADGITTENFGRLAANLPAISPCTPYGVMHLLKKYGVKIDGANAVVVGRSGIVGKPLSFMLLNENATVTICHSHTKNLPEVCKTADILIAAIGSPEFITADFVKPGTVVIDVGINRGPTLENGKSKLLGDVKFDEVASLASLITPVPGGIGPMTVAMLFKNVITLTKWQLAKENG